MVANRCIPTLLFLIVLMSQPLLAANPELYLVAFDRQHTPYGEEKRYFYNHGSRSMVGHQQRRCNDNPLLAAKGQQQLHNGLYYWDSKKRKLQLLFGGCHACASSHHGICVANEAGHVDYSRQIEVYEKSTIATSPDGRWLAISGVVLDLPPTIFGEVREGASANRQPALFRQFYRVHLVDLHNLDQGIDAVYTLLDTYDRYFNGPNIISMIDPELMETWPMLVEEEFGSNPLSPDQSYFESFDLGFGAEFDFDFHDSESKLTVKINTHNLDELWREDMQTYQGVHRTFVIDFADPNKPQVMRGIKRNTTYKTATTVTAANDMIKSFALSPDGAYLAKSRVVPKERAGALATFLGKTDKYVHEFFIESPRRPQDFVDNEVDAETRFGRLYALKEDFEPEIRWFGEQIFVRKDANHAAVFSMETILAEADKHWLDTAPLNVAADFDTDNEQVYFHAAPMEILRETGRSDRYRTSEAYIRDNHLIMTEAVPMAVGLTGMLPTLFNMDLQQERYNSRYLVYGAYVHVRDRFGEGQLREYWQRYSEDKDDYVKSPWRAAANYHYVEQGLAAAYLEASLTQPYISADKQYAYFLETRWQGDPDTYEEVLATSPAYGPEHLRFRASMDMVTTWKLCRHEDFRVLSWPLLARIDLTKGDERDIERLGSNNRGNTYWSPGLPVENYPKQPRGWFVPMQGVVDYLIVEEPVSPAKQPSTASRD